MKHIAKLTIGLITIALVGYSKYESEISTNVSTKISRANPTFIARQDNAPLTRSALDRLAENITVEIVIPGVISPLSEFTTAGSGVIIGKKGSTYYVLTANHIFRYSNSDYQVFVRSKKPGEDAERVKLQIIRRYPKQDLAVIAFASLKEYKIAEIGETSQLSNDSQVYVAGWARSLERDGFQFTPAKVTNPRAGDNLNYQPTESGEGVYPGMSGGAVLNEKGHLVGIHVGVVEKGGDGKGVLISTFLQDMPQDVGEVLVMATLVPLPSPIENLEEPEEKPGQNGYMWFVVPIIFIVPALFWIFSLLSGFRNNRGKVYSHERRRKKHIPYNKEATQLYSQNPGVYNNGGNVNREQEKGKGVAVLSTSTREKKSVTNADNVTPSQTEDAESYYDQADKHDDRGEYEEALADLNQAIRLNPKLTKAYNLRGIVYYNQGEYDLALADLNQAILLNPKDVDAYNGRGIVYYNQGEYELAIADYNQAILLNPKYADAYNNRGLVYDNQGEYELAIADYNQAILLNPKYAYAYNGRGLVYDNQGEYDLAITDYNQAILLNPKFAPAYYNRGIVYDNQGEYDLAIADYSESIRLNNPELWLPYNGRGNVYYNQGENDLAIADYNQAILLNPKYAYAYNGRGLVYDNQGEYDLALADFNQAILLNPKFAYAYNGRGIVYYNQGEYGLALADYNQAILLNPKYAYAYNNRGLVYNNQGEYDLALADFNQAILLNPKFANPYYGRGNVYKRNRDIEKARADFEKAADLYKQQGNQKWYQNSLDRLKELQGN